MTRLISSVLNFLTESHYDDYSGHHFLSVNPPKVTFLRLLTDTSLKNCCVSYVVNRYERGKVMLGFYCITVRLTFFCTLEQPRFILPRHVQKFFIPRFSFLRQKCHNQGSSSFFSFLASVVIWVLVWQEKNYACGTLRWWRREWERDLHWDRVCSRLR